MLPVLAQFYHNRRLPFYTWGSWKKGAACYGALLYESSMPTDDGKEREGDEREERGRRAELRR
jgi:hypothetical protein